MEIKDIPRREKLKNLSKRVLKLTLFNNRSPINFDKKYYLKQLGWLFYKNHLFSNDIFLYFFETNK